MHLSNPGITTLKELEGLCLDKYADARECPTIGWGHKALETDTFGNTITEAEAEALLAQDVGFAEDAVNDLVQVPLKQGQFDALVCFTFNEGRRHLAESTLRRVLNQKQYSLVPHELRKWVFSKGMYLIGLVNRRNKEILLWNE